VDPLAGQRVRVGLSGDFIGNLGALIACFIPSVDKETKQRA
jgi:hypothetical protein